MELDADNIGEAARHGVIARTPTTSWPRKPPRRPKNVISTRAGLDAGELALGPEGFEEYDGHFWGFLETRPYMRARHGLALALLKLVAKRYHWRPKDLRDVALAVGGPSGRPSLESPSTTSAGGSQNASSGSEWGKGQPPPIPRKKGKNSRRKS